MQEILRRFDQLDQKIDHRFDQLDRKIDTEHSGLRSEMLSRLAELEMRVTTALLDVVKSHHELVAELREHRLTRDQRIEELTKRVEILEAKLG